MELIKARTRDEALIREIHEYRNDPSRFHLWWLGQSGFLLLWNKKQLLLDPYLSDSLTRKYAETDKPHIRMSERVVDPALLQNITIVTSSHNHTDHLDAETLRPIFQNNPLARMVIPEANRKLVCERIGKEESFPVGMNENTQQEIDGFHFYGIPASHNTIEKDELGRCRFMGFVIRFGEWTIYHSGDTLWFDEMVDLLKPYKIDLAILPINGNDPSRRVAGNLDAKEAAQLGRQIGARMVIPCHYHMFSFNTADPEDFIKEARSIGQPHHVPEHGGHFHSGML